ncbi:hypothetical protein C0Q70_10389 [Pomacea canaliculata]|uniref:Uncharacterized protein n=1 Tax=Pomacea canaliculata TaxID=400727 RepID=A0A2T7PCI2_POMCA|nr:hypothetical protein C0Q70_10389 [Pomacea canaliculata]
MLPATRSDASRQHFQTQQYRQHELAATQLPRSDAMMGDPWPQIVASHQGVRQRKARYNAPSSTASKKFF